MSFFTKILNRVIGKKSTDSKRESISTKDQVYVNQNDIEKLFSLSGLNKNDIFNIQKKQNDMFLQIELLKNSTDSGGGSETPTNEIVGFGKNATGGEGGTVYTVTNLNATGSGSFSDAINKSGTRIIEFSVGGEIDLNGTNIQINTNSDNITIDGSTAPSPITITGGMFMVLSSNVIIKHIRFRPESGAPAGADGISISAFSGTTLQNIVIQNCSISSASDENLNIRGVGTGVVKNVTVQDCIISDNNYATLFDGLVQDITLHNNYLAFNTERNFRLGTTNYTDLGLEFTNNLIYGFVRGTQINEGCRFSIINNYYRDSPSVTRLSTVIIEPVYAGTGDISTTEAYITGNETPAGSTAYSSDYNPYIVGSPTNSSGISLVSATDVPTRILTTVGASLPSRDAIDTQLVLDWNNNN